MVCKCCGESAEFILKEEGYWKNRYRCSNCNKIFGEDHRWLKDIKKAGQVMSVITIVSKVASGDLQGAVTSIVQKLTGSDDTTIV